MDIKQIAEEIIRVWYLSADSLNLATVSRKI